MPNYYRFRLSAVGLVIILLSQSFSGFSQSLDSLKNELITERSSMEQLDLLSKITEKSMFDHPDSATKYGQMMIEISKNGIVMAEKIMQPIALHFMATSHLIKSEIDSAAKIYLEAIDTYQTVIDEMMLSDNFEIKEIYWESIKRQSRSYNNLAICYFNQSIYDSAIFFYQTAIDLNVKVVDGNSTNWSEKAASDIGGIYTNIASVIERQGEYERALEYGWKAKKYLEAGQDKRSLMSNYTNLGAYHSFVSHFDSALYYYNRAIEIASDLGDDYNIITNKSNIGTAYLYIGRWEESIEYLSEAYNYYKKYNDIQSMFPNEDALTEAFLKLKKYDSALHYLDKVLIHGKELNTQPQLVGSLGTASQVYSEMAESTGNIKYYRFALRYSEEYHKMNDSLFNATKDRNLKELEVKFETAQKEKENILLQKEKTANETLIEKQKFWVYSLIGGGILLAILFFISYRFYLERKKVAKQLAEDKEIITKQAKELQALDSFKSRFFANVSHDLRTPLTLIQGYLSSIKTGGSYLDTNAEESIMKLEANTSKLVMLTDEIKDLILLEDDKLQLKFSRIEIVTYMQTLVNLFSSAAEMNHVHLNFTSELKSPLIIHLDFFQFEKIMYNLLANALKFSTKEGHIEVSLSNNEESVLITIKDDGAGIAPDKVAYIFSRYFQASDEIHYNKEGMGIGLALVMELIKLHGGTINVESELGKGSAFFVTLPHNLDKDVTSENPDLNFIKNNKVLLEELTNTEPLVDLSETEKRKSNAPTVLIVDDHPDIREYIQGIIEDDHIIRQAANGKEALVVLEREKIDVVITDLMMPWMGGHELIEKMKNQEVFKDIPILVISARTTEEDKLKVLEVGINNFLAKPFQPNELKLRIANALSSSDARSNIWEALAKDKKKLNDVQKNVLAKVNTLILSRIDDSSLSVQDIADMLATSSRNAYNILKEIAGVNPKDYIKLIKFQYAEDLIKKKKVKSLTEAARAIGMSNATDFGKQFQKKMGVNPAELLG